MEDCCPNLFDFPLVEVLRVVVVVDCVVVVVDCGVVVVDCVGVVVDCGVVVGAKGDVVGEEIEVVDGGGVVVEVVVKVGGVDVSEGLDSVASSFITRDFLFENSPLI